MLSIILLIGLIFCVLLVVFFKGPIIDLLKDDNKLLKKLENTWWFKSYWLAGTFLFVMNAALFTSTILLLFGLTYFFIPYAHIIIMLIAIIGSVFLWILVHKAWKGTKNGRLKMSAIGSSFYLILTFAFVYQLLTLKPSYPNDDQFMAFVGLVFAIIVTTVAAAICFSITGLPKKNPIEK